MILNRLRVSLSASAIEPDSYIGAFDKDVELLVEMYEGFDSDYEDSTSTDQSRIKQHIEEIVEEDLDAEDYDYTNVSFDGANNDDASLYATFTYYIEVDEDELIELAKDNKKIDYRSILRELEKPIDRLSYDIDIEHEMDGNEYFTLTYKLNEDYPVENIIDDLPGNLKYLDEPEIMGDDLVFEIPYDPEEHKDLKEYKEGIMKEVMQVFNRLTAKKGIKLTKGR